MAQRDYESVGSTELIQATNCYTRFEAYLSRYRFARINLNNVSSTLVPISLNSTSLLEWKLPARTVYNLGRSYINYQLSMAGIIGGSTQMFIDNQTLAQWVYFGDGGGLGLADLNYADRYTSVIAPLRTTIIEAETRDQMNTCYMTDNQATNYLPFSSDGILNGTSFSSTSNNELQHLLSTYDAPLANTPATIMNLAFQIPLSIFSGTYIGLDKNSIFGRDMYLRMNTNYASRMGYNSTEFPVAPALNYQVFTVASAPQNLINIYLFLALEENAVLVNSLMESLNQGKIKLCIPYTYTYRYSGAGSSSNMSITLTRQFGHKLKRLLYAPFVGGQNEQGNTAYDHSNVNGTKITQFQTSMDSRPLTDYQNQCFNPNNSLAANGSSIVLPTFIPANSGFVTATGTTGGTNPNGDDYREMRDRMLAGSCITSYSVYQNFWSYADLFGMQNFLKQSFNTSLDDSNIDDGLNLLDADHVYSIQASTPCINNANSACANSIIHYLFALFERNVAVTPDGLMFF